MGILINQLSVWFNFHKMRKKKKLYSQFAFDIITIFVNLDIIKIETLQTSKTEKNFEGL